MVRRPLISTGTAPLFPFTTLCRSPGVRHQVHHPLLADPHRIAARRSRAAALARHLRLLQHGQRQAVGSDREVAGPAAAGNLSKHVTRRSEEHTSELQSLMSISYAVSCLKKKKSTN